MLLEHVTSTALVVSPVKSRRNRCLHSVESAVATLKCLQTDDSLTTEVTSSSLRTLRRSSGGRAARPNATGRAMAGDRRQRHHSDITMSSLWHHYLFVTIVDHSCNLVYSLVTSVLQPAAGGFMKRSCIKWCDLVRLKLVACSLNRDIISSDVLRWVLTCSGCSDQRVRQLVFEDPGQLLQIFERCGSAVSWRTIETWHQAGYSQKLTEASVINQSELFYLATRRSRSWRGSDTACGPSPRFGSPSEPLQSQEEDEHQEKMSHSENTERSF